MPDTKETPNETRKLRAANAQVKRQIDDLKEQPKDSRCHHHCRKCSKSESRINKGRLICCLVTLFNNVGDLVQENDRWSFKTNNDEAEGGFESAEAYTELVYYMQEVKEKLVLKDQEQLSIIPPLSSHTKDNRGFKHNMTGKLLCPVGYDWSYERFLGDS
ncbi:hypothetical protein SERLA73DRAFT_148842 [Serpula lacrymans var. lacrymans S7.3]|uniref:Uncharacterized protein n=2 Tax=Serpula lacrymans var. lacrymans TaxID=341189 RepID=F8PFQ3_SERL3|nr:uncharacterized protein SERLADRAFT_404475 [Serpula lacrymans var. lacrymans S7.9]EGO04254.1 hypothetical protein SERLA73DRAFT_148842 [Serpula lacrymans var. lacrymans S7.3]EGO30188.1 hypothetical protein SERLADRAFT_404475 [Serpula lacrymans var. lacrymans S7.9]